ncbi:MAG: PD-(D/E)XK nuclease family protein [Candidatus Thermoplasmatota archaeon]|nr:PD-(D/E)XK nuclease family protein [Candidatus Thermoplasmatota archaeon]
MRISTTSLPLLVECPLCFWLHHKKGLARPGYPLPRILSQLDSAIKEYIKKYQNTKELPQWLKERGVKGRLLGPQYLEYECPEVGVVLTGKLDELLLEDEGYCVIDFKSGRLPPNNQPPYYYQIQLDSYCYLVEKCRNTSANKALLIYFSLIPGDELDNNFLPVDIEILEVRTKPQSTLELLKKAKEVIELETPPQPDENCVFCNWRTNISKLSLY